jgi:hypothetical protein
MKGREFVVARVVGLASSKSGFPVSVLSQVSELPEGHRFMSLGWGEGALRDALVAHPWVLEQLFGATGTRLLASELYKVDVTAVHEHPDGPRTRMFELKLAKSIPNDREIAAQAFQRAAPAVAAISAVAQGTFPLPVDVVVLRPARRSEARPQPIHSASHPHGCSPHVHVLRFSTAATFTDDYLLIGRSDACGLDGVDLPRLSIETPGLGKAQAERIAKKIADALGNAKGDSASAYGIVASATVGSDWTGITMLLRVANRTPYIMLGIGAKLARLTHVEQPAWRLPNVAGVLAWWSRLDALLSGRTPERFTYEGIAHDEFANHVWLGPRCSTWEQALDVGEAAAAEMATLLSPILNRNGGG